MSRYLIDEELQWLRIRMREERQVAAVGDALVDFGCALSKLTFSGSFCTGQPFATAMLWADIIRGLGCPEPGSIVRVL